MRSSRSQGPYSHDLACLSSPNLGTSSTDDVHLSSSFKLTSQALMDSRIQDHHSPIPFFNPSSNQKSNSKSSLAKLLKFAWVKKKPNHISDLKVSNHQPELSSLKLSINHPPTLSHLPSLHDPQPSEAPLLHSKQTLITPSLSHSNSHSLKPNPSRLPIPTPLPHTRFIQRKPHLKPQRSLGSLTQRVSQAQYQSPRTTSPPPPLPPRLNPSSLPSVPRSLRPSRTLVPPSTISKPSKDLHHPPLLAPAPPSLISITHRPQASSSTSAPLPPPSRREPQAPDSDLALRHAFGRPPPGPPRQVMRGLGYPETLMTRQLQPRLDDRVSTSPLKLLIYDFIFHFNQQTQFISFFVRVRVCVGDGDDGVGE